MRGEHQKSETTDLGREFDISWPNDLRCKYHILVFQANQVPSLGFPSFALVIDKLQEMLSQ